MPYGAELYTDEIFNREDFVWLLNFFVSLFEYHLMACDWEVQQSPFSKGDLELIIWDCIGPCLAFLVVP